MASAKGFFIKCLSVNHCVHSLSISFEQEWCFSLLSSASPFWYDKIRRKDSGFPLHKSAEGREAHFSAETLFGSQELSSIHQDLSSNFRN